MTRPVVLPAAFTNPLADVLAKDAEKFREQSIPSDFQRSWQYMTDALGHHLPASITRAKNATARLRRMR